jgi:hypothetical protein
MKLLFLALTACLLTILGVLPSIAANQVLLRYLDIGGNGSVFALTSDQNGDSR